MLKRSRLLLTVVTAAIVLGGLTGVASANRLALNDEDLTLNYRALTFSAAGASISCSITLEASFHERTIVKQPGDLIGHITHVALARPCTGGEATVLTADLPWHVTYYGFSGDLPEITHLRLLLHGASYRIDPTGSLPACLMRTTAEAPGFLLIEVFELSMTSAAMDETALIPLGGSFMCNLADVAMSGTGTIGRQGGGALTITLV